MKLKKRNKDRTKLGKKKYLSKFSNPKLRVPSKSKIFYFAISLLRNQKHEILIQIN